MKNKNVPPSPIPPRGSSPRCTDYRPGLPPLPESSSQSPPSSSAAALPQVPAPSAAALSLPEIIRAYRPLVLAVAGRYQGRGADFCDLEQEGYLALLILVPQCPDMNWLAYFLRCRLPGVVRDAAARLRRARARAGMLLEEIEETLGAEEGRYREIELRATLARELTTEEYRLAQLLSEGNTQSEIAKELGVTQQAVAARLKKIRAKLKKALRE